ncbi:hypothetical protein, conserved [Leishmania donovani]|uniref:Synaptojanin (N-terminal domain), putative n=1 Tax=Leishmania donovani TaxID=5661 RepID=E9BSV0_LEIDO|nr:hypothetical protein, conserved [Leishmania donovani]AYU83230.1 synaptojanin (N-terminal domain), putative [Leishmania donovani]CBZ38329.1 hypothetical protein, conserved [Leishmania donovani]
MSRPTWSHGGRILFNASRVYYVPNEPCLPPLRWMPERQRFEYLRKDIEEDVSLRASLAELAEACSQLYQLQPLQQQLPAASLNGYLPCEALYGVLPLGAASNSALLYVTEKEYVCTLCVGGAEHDVFAVRGLQWLFLPCATSALSGRRQSVRPQQHHRGSVRSGNRNDGEMPDGADDDAESDMYGRHPCNSRNDNSTSETDEEEDDDAENGSSTMQRLPTKTLNDYLAVLNRFCESINIEDGGQRARAAAAAAAYPHTDGEVEERSSQLPGIVGPANRFSYLYYSPTLDLSADPAHLLALITHSAHPHVEDGAASTGGGAVSYTTNGSLSSNTNRDSSGTTTEFSDQPRLSTRGRHSAASYLWEERRAAALTRQLYQWNGPLIGDAFALPTLAALREEEVRGRAESSKKPSALESRREPWRFVCADELLRDELAQYPNRGGHGGGAVSLPAGTMPATSFSSLPLYMPSYIRGLVAQAVASPSVRMTLVTRICCRWAGTRYNRRGLEPGHSGVVANMAMTSLWVTPQSTTSAAPSTERSEATSGARRFAVYSMLRGSVPRRWEQPANLSLKPTIKIAPVGNAAEELGRHVRLLKQCLPQLHALYCLDTMSTSELEEPLSEAFATAVRRYNEDPPSPFTAAKGGTYLATSSAGATAEEKDGAAAAVTASNGEDWAGASHTPARDPMVTLVKYNVKRALKTLSYAAMMRECIAKLDRESGGDTWLDFTNGEAHAPRAGEDRAAMGGGESTLQNSSSLTGTEADARHRDAAPRLSLAHVQSRLVRVNCLDCLDRTNLVQSFLCCAALPQMIEYVEGRSQERNQPSASAERLSRSDGDLTQAFNRLRLLLVAQGTAVAQLYAGTKPHFVPYMLNGHYHWSHKARESVLALRRWYQQNFFDGVKQDGVSLVTRQHDPQVFNADIESPFSRDLSGMNHQVLCGVLLGVMPFLYSLLMCVSERGGFSSFVFQLHFGICMCWIAYFSVLYNKLMRYRATYTNRPLLLYTRQADWC